MSVAAATLETLTGLAAAYSRKLRALLIRTVEANWAFLMIMPPLALAASLDPGLITVIRNALIPVVTLLGLRIGRLIGGVVIVEVVFSLPGIGQMPLNAVLFKDMPVLQPGVLLVAFAVTLLNLPADLSHSLIDPRIQFS